MKAVIFCGGFGTRLSEYTKNIPKPLVPINGKPLILELIETMNLTGVNEFFLALGYKAENFKNYFMRLQEASSNFSINFDNGEIEFHETVCRKWKVHLIDTGLNTMTGGRLLNISKYIPDENFIVTYGDGLANINCELLFEHHIKSDMQATITAVRPDARFGRLQTDGSKVTNFSEKHRMNEGWINGGFMVVNKSFISRISGEECVLEEEPLTTCAQDGQLGARFHEGFWQCMDNTRDKERLESFAKSRRSLPWKESFR